MGEDLDKTGLAVTATLSDTTTKVDNAKESYGSVDCATYGIVPALSISF